MCEQVMKVNMCLRSTVILTICCYAYLLRHWVGLSCITDLQNQVVVKVKTLNFIVMLIKYEQRTVTILIIKLYCQYAYAYNRIVTMFMCQVYCSSILRSGKNQRTHYAT